MVALHTKRFSSEWGLALQPSGGSFLIAFKSDISRSCAEDDILRARTRVRVTPPPSSNEILQINLLFWYGVPSDLRKQSSRSCKLYRSIATIKSRKRKRLRSMLIEEDQGERGKKRKKSSDSG
jgi:hypothetical protein